MTDVEFYDHGDFETKERHERFDRAIGWAMFVTDLGTTCCSIGRLDLKPDEQTSFEMRDPDLHESIDLLGGFDTATNSCRRNDLQEAGEYAVPAPLRTLHNSE